MTNQKAKFIDNRLCLNVLANSIENAKEIYGVTEGHVVLGLLSKNFKSDEEALAKMKTYQMAINNALSIGLGAGDPAQSAMVARISAILQPQHVNQVFTGVNGTRMLLKQNETIVNGLVSPTGRVGYVNIGTGPLSATQAPIIVSVYQAISLLRDMGGNSIKFFPMKGLTHLEEYQAVCEACASEGFWLEPTGGIDLENYQKIIEIPLKMGVKRVIPHIYNAIIDPQTNDTIPEKVSELYRKTRKVLAELAE